MEYASLTVSNQSKYLKTKNNLKRNRDISGSPDDSGT